jgi:osmoprotectant transport system substrate-binding protein
MIRAWICLALLLPGCAHGGSDAVVVGGKNFTEQRILGELLAQSIEAAGMRVDRKLDLGGTFVCDSAIRAGQIDVYVEYTGTALGAILKDAAKAPAAPVVGTADTPKPDAAASKPPSAEATTAAKATSDNSPAAVLAKVRAAYIPAGLIWTAPLGFDNTFALVVRNDVTQRTISDAVTPARDWRAAFGYEFQQRADGYPALTRAYGLSFAEVHTMDLGLLYRALTERQADVVVGSATDAAISRFSLRVLEDDRHAFPPYEAVPVVRAETLQRYPALKPTLERLGGSLDIAAMRHLNEAVDIDHRAPADVVREFLVARQ